jgi:hypothetical protein
MKMPIDISEIQRFLELIFYYWKFIKEYTQIVKFKIIKE